MSSIKDQIVTLLKQRHHSHKVALEQEKDPRSKHAVDLIARIREDSKLIELIDSLPEEKATCKTCGFYENNCPFIRGKLIPYPNKVCKDYTYSAMKEQEKPSEDLEEAAGEYSAGIIDRKDAFMCKAAFIAGAEWQRVEMMKDAVEAEITVGRLPDDWSLAYNPDELHRALLKFKSGDKVKIIIVKQ